MFNLYSEEALSKIKICEGTDLLVTNYNNFRYSDDTALIADSEIKVQRKREYWSKDKLFENVCDAYQQKGRDSRRSCVGQWEKKIAQVNKSKNLGIWTTSDGRSYMDIKGRIGQANNIWSVHLYG